MKLARIVAVVGVMFWLLFFGASRAAALEDITVSYSGPSVGFLATEIARQKGFFREQEQEVKFIMTRSEVDRVGIATGDIDFTLRPGATLVAAARGLPVRVIFITAAKSMWAMVARPEFNSPRDLKGRTVGIGGVSGANHLAAKAIFKQHKLDPDKDIVYKVLTGSQVAAIQSGSIDAMLMNYNEAALARKAGYRVLLNAADYHNSITSGVGAGTRLLKDHPERVKRFLRGMLKGLKYLRENRDGTRAIAMSWLKLERESADAVLDLSMGAYTADGALDDSSLKLLSEQFLADANLTPVPVSQLVDLSLLKQILR